MLYAIQGVCAYHVAQGKEASLTPAGPQTLSLLMVPTSSQFADSSFDTENSSVDDFYLHLHLPPELDVPLPATTQIYHQPPRSYLIPRWDLGPQSGAFTRLEFQAAGSREGLQEDIDTFETILAQCTAFLERAPPPKPPRPKGKEKDPATSSARTSPTSAKMRPPASSARHSLAPASARVKSEDVLPAYNPGTFSPGEGYVRGSHSSHRSGQIVLVDEEDGSVIGELGDGYEVVTDSAVQPGSKGKSVPCLGSSNADGIVDPVEITLPGDGETRLAVAPASREAVEMEMHPAYKKSFLVSKAVYASRLIVTTSDIVTKGLQSGADSFSQKTKPVERTVTFTPATHDRVRKINKFSGSVADLSSKTVGQVGKVAHNLGATLSGRKAKDATPRGYGPDGEPLESFKPGLLNKSLMAFSTIADGLDQATRNLMNGTSTAATSMVTHRWGSEAGELSKHLGGSAKNVGLVYIDVTGVSRRAILKAVGKGMVVGKVKGGGQVIVGEDTSDLSVGRKLPTRPNTLSPSTSSSGSSTMQHSSDRRRAKKGKLVEEI